MTRQFASYYLTLSTPSRYGTTRICRGWIVTADSKRDAKKHARQQLSLAFGGRWRVESVGLATQAQLDLAWRSFA